MSKGVSGPTWVLLSPSKLPDATEVYKILGAIVPDFEHPLQNTIPEDASKVVPKKWLAKPTTDGNFKVVLDRARSNGAYVKLGEILHAAFNKDISNNMHLSSTVIKTYAVTQENKLFDLLKRRFNDEILQLFERAPSRNNRSVFAIEAVKTCANAEISRKSHVHESQDVKAKVPGKEIVTAITGVPPPIDPSVEAGQKSSETEDTDQSQIADGERIFAIQYRIVKHRSGWLKVGKPKLPVGYDLKDLYIPKGPSMYGDAEEDADHDDDEVALDEDFGSEEDDPIELGDLEHTWTLSELTGAGAVMI